MSELLGGAAVEAGRYTQIRIPVSEVMIHLKDQADPVAARVPGEMIRIVRTFTVEPGETTELLLDFDGERSLVVTGAGRYIFQPVIKLSVPREGGKVTPAVEVTATPAASATPLPTASPEPTATPPATATAVPTTPPTATPTVTATPTPSATPDALGATFFLEIVSPRPEPGDEIIVVSESSVAVEGRTRIDAAVTVGDAFAEVDEDGKFEVTVELAEGPNIIEVVASVGTGEEEAIVVIISFEPEG